MTEKFTSVDEYIDSFPAEQQQILREIRRTLLKAVPGGEEKYRYDKIAPFRAAKDSVNFPYSTPIPYELIGRVAAALAERHSAAD